MRKSINDMKYEFINNYGIKIIKYDNFPYAEVVIPSIKLGNIICKIRKKDIPYFKKNKIQYTFRNGKHEINRRPIQNNTLSAYPVLSELCPGCKMRLQPDSINSKYFDLYDICNIYERTFN